MFLDLEITCPNDIVVYINRSVAESKNVSWDKPLVRNKENDTKFSVEVFPQWAEPPVIFPKERPMYVIKYMVKNEFGQTASCFFNITVYNDSCKFHIILFLLLKFVFLYTWYSGFTIIISHRRQ